jgi:hypothetical protein
MSDEMKDALSLLLWMAVLGLLYIGFTRGPQILALIDRVLA